jgi:hypothetical protein
MNDKQQAAFERAKLAAGRLERTRAWIGERCLVDLALLCQLASRPDTKWITVHHGEHTWSIERKRLGELRRAMKPWPGATCALDDHGFHVRWRGGKGGLDLRSSPPVWQPGNSQAELEFHVHLGQPAVMGDAEIGPAPTAPPAPVPTPKPTAEPTAPQVVQAGPGLAFVVPSGEYTIAFWRAFHAACSR